MASKYTGAITQDSESVVLHKSKPKAVNQALRSGAAVQTVYQKKFSAKPVVAKEKKHDKGTEPAATEVGQAIQKARREKKMSQADLAKQINETPQVVKEYENGKAAPKQDVLAKMEKVLGVELGGRIGK